MNRRTLLKVAGLIAAGRVVATIPTVGGRDLGLVPTRAGVRVEPASGPEGMSLTIAEPGIYRISGLVQLQGPLVEISGSGHSQSISWSGGETSQPPVARFMVFERFDEAGMRPDIHVRGGQLIALDLVPLG